MAAPLFISEGHTLVEPHQRIEYTITDGRNVSVLFEDVNGSTRITESFDPNMKTRRNATNRMASLSENFKSTRKNQKIDRYSSFRGCLKSPYSAAISKFRDERDFLNKLLQKEQMM